MGRRRIRAGRTDGEPHERCLRDLVCVLRFPVAGAQSQKVACLGFVSHAAQAPKVACLGFGPSELAFSCGWSQECLAV